MPPPGSVLREATKFDSILALDLIFVLDTSGSVGTQGFDDAKSFALKMVNIFPMGRNLIHMGAIAFGTMVFDISPLTSSSSQFVNALVQFPYQGGGTNTTGALLEAKRMFLSSPRNVTRLKRVLILVTDGHSNTHKIEPEAVVPRLAYYSIDRFVFGVGNNINPHELEAIASPPSDRHVFNVSSFGAFASFSEFLRPSNYTPCNGIVNYSG